MPIIICLVLLTFYLICGAILFVEWEGWAFHSAVYFTFITISTIGYGDYYPQSAMVEDLTADFAETAKMLFVVLYLILGTYTVIIDDISNTLLNIVKCLAKSSRSKQYCDLT